MCACVCALLFSSVARHGTCFTFSEKQFVHCCFTQSQRVSELCLHLSPQCSIHNTHQTHTNARWKTACICVIVCHGACKGRLRAVRRNNIVSIIKLNFVWWLQHDQFGGNYSNLLPFLCCHYVARHIKGQQMHRQQKTRCIITNSHAQRPNNHSDNDDIIRVIIFRRGRLSVTDDIIQLSLHLPKQTKVHRVKSVLLSAQEWRVPDW